MGVILSGLIYYLVASVIAGSVMGAGFATNLGRRADKVQLETVQKLGVVMPLRIEGLEGDLIAQPNERRPTIIYIHGRSASRDDMAPRAQALFEPVTYDVDDFAPPVLLVRLWARALLRLYRPCRQRRSAQPCPGA